MANNTPEKNTMSRREFLHKAGLVAAGVTLSTLTGCSSSNQAAEALTPSPTKTADARPTTVPTAIPTPEATRDLDAERQARWQDKFWKIGLASQDTGGLQLPGYDEDMSAFRNELTQMAEENGFSSETVDMVLLGHNAGLNEESDLAEPVSPTEFYGLMILKDSILCFTKDETGLSLEENCDWFKKSQEVWGDNWSYRVVSTVGEDSRSSFLMREEDEQIKIFRPSHDQFGILTIEESFVDGEMTEDEEGVWTLDGEVKPVEAGKTMTGVLVTGEKDGQIGYFLFECQTLKLDRAFKEGILPRSADLVNGWVPVEMSLETEAEFKTVGHLDLKDGTWQGEAGYEEIESILIEKAVAVETLEDGEVLIGEHFIGLPDDKIVELLDMPENERKMALPVYVDQNTEIIVDTKPDAKDANAILLKNVAEKNVYMTGRFGVIISTIPGGYYLATHATGVRVLAMDVDRIAVQQISLPGFGDLLMEGCKTSSEGNDLVIYSADDDTGDYLMTTDFLLIRDGRYVVRVK